MNKIYKYYYTTKQKENLFKFLDSCIDKSVARFKNPVHHFEYRMFIDNGNSRVIIFVKVEDKI